MSLQDPRISATGPAALVTARLTEAVREFDDGSTSAALDHLAALIEEAPARADLRDTAERWARVLRRRAHEARDAVPKPRRVTWPAPLRAANQLLRIGDAQLQNGEMIAAARSFEKGRAAWARLADVVAARRDGRAGAQASRIDSSAHPRCARGRGGCGPAPRSPRPMCPRPLRPRRASPRRRPSPRWTMLFERVSTGPWPPSSRRSTAAAPIRCRPIWPSLSSGALQSYRSQFSRTLFQQWTYTARDIRVGPNGNRAIAECTVTVSIQEAGSRETRARPATSGSSSNASDRSGSLRGVGRVAWVLGTLGPRVIAASWRAGSSPPAQMTPPGVPVHRALDDDLAGTPFVALDDGTEARAGRQRRTQCRPAR